VAAALKPVDVVRVRDGAGVAFVDRAATEEPLEVRLHGRPFAVIMRTPGADRELAAGFLLAERVIISADDLGTIQYCTEKAPSTSRGGGTAAFSRRGRSRKADPVHAGAADPTASRANGGAARIGPGPEAERYAENVVNVTLVGDRRAQVDGALALRRRVMTSSSCGLCGRLTIESLKVDVGALPVRERVEARVVTALPQRLRDAQALFDDTGGLHAAGLFTLAGELIAAAEDVGRHNAVDKVVGRMLMADALPLADRILAVSGRTSYEIVQKALIAGVAVVASVSAPSTLAIELAHETGVTLLGFVRGGTFNIYTHAARIVL
jgi:FdhD protein